MSTDRHATQARFAVVIKKQYGTVIRTNVPRQPAHRVVWQPPLQGVTPFCVKKRENCRQIAAMIRAAAEEVLAFEVVAVVMGYHTLTAQ